MKKFTAMILCLAAFLGCLFAFSACTETNESGDEKESGKQSEINVSALTMEKHYYRETDIRLDKRDSYLFHANGTGEYEYHYDYISEYVWDSDVHQHYIIHFKYTYVDNDKSSVVCFYDSLEGLDGDDGSYISTGWSELITVSQNVLMTVGSSYIFWINEDYLGEIPNFKA